MLLPSLSDSGVGDLTPSLTRRKMSGRAALIVGGPQTAVKEAQRGAEARHAVHVSLFSAFSGDANRTASTDHRSPTTVQTMDHRP